MATSGKNYYETLGVAKNATQDEISRAFKQKARKMHPDVNHAPNAKEQFQELNEAYEVLSNPDKRRQYDNPSPFSGFGGRPGAGTTRQWTDENGNMHFEFNGNGGGGFSQFSDFFNWFGGRGGGRGRRTDPNAPRPGESLAFGLSVGFREAIDGCTKKVRLNVEDNCGCLNGCDKCGHTGRIQKTVTLEVKIPSGCPDGQRLRIAGQGNRGYNGGPNGDIFFQIDVSDDPDGIFIRDGFDLLQKVEVPFETFILGGEIEYHTLDGVEKYVVQPFTKPGKILVLQGRGVHVMNSLNANGDLRILLDLKMPTSLTDRERELLEKYREERGRNSK